MNWFLWFLVGWWVASAVVNVSMVGKPREPLEPGIAAAVVVVNALLIAGVFLFGAAR